MTRIDLGPVKPKVQQCGTCGRVRINGVWTRDDSVTPGVVVRCAMCGETARLTRERAERAHNRRLRSGNFDREPVANPFEFVKYDGKGE